MQQEIANKILKETEENYDAISQEFITTRKYGWSIFDYFKKFIKDGDNILDVGCGGGRLVEALKGSIASYIGVDVALPHLESARKHYKDIISPKIQFIQAGATDLSILPDTSFDCIFCVAAYHHMPSKELRQRSLSEFYRLLKPGGKLIMTNWNLLSFWAIKKYWPEAVRVIFPHQNLDAGDTLIPWKVRGRVVVNRFYHAFTLGEIKKEVLAANFKILENRYIKEDKSSNVFFGDNILTITEK